MTTDGTLSPAEWEAFERIELGLCPDCAIRHPPGPCLIDGEDEVCRGCSTPWAHCCTDKYPRCCKACTHYLEVHPDCARAWRKEMELDP